MAFRLYLTEAWTNDEERRRKGGIPEIVAFQGKPQIALDQIRRPIANTVP
nr:MULTISPECIES: transposase [Rhodomicrobium]